jgi:acetyl-CoA C-acetyltransferase
MKGKLQREVCIIGVGMTKIGRVTDTTEIKGMTYRELMTSAAIEAMKDANITLNDIDAFYVSNAGGHLYIERQIHLSNLAASWIGLVEKPGAFVGDACAASSLAIREGIFAIASSVHDVVLVVGAEIYSARVHMGFPGHIEMLNSEDCLQNVVHTHYDQAWEKPQMGQNAAYYAQWIISYAKKYGLSADQMFDTMDEIIITNYYNGYNNPKTFMRIKVEDVAKQAGFDNPKKFLRSTEHNPFVFWPIRVWDYERIADGSAAVILCAEDIANSFSRKPVRILGIGAAQGTPISEEMYTHSFRVKAAMEAYKMANVKPADIDIIEVHDSCVAQYLIALEDMGYLQRGEAWKAIIAGETRIGGGRPVNTLGGGQTGRPIGLHGLIQTYNIVKQLRGEGGGCQVSPRPDLGLIYDDGAARNAVVMIVGEV